MTAGRDDILVVVTSDHGNANPGLNGMGSGYAESTQRFERITRFKASHERIFAEWNKLKDGDVAAVGRPGANAHLDFGLKQRGGRSPA